ncbi:capsid protein [Sewage-associated circular DNA virus-29]|uniref:Capsid protein n=1 Tax=Sewage-associated circular DNA virus-29 TaxID=1592096 RepID=A0A0B4UGN4_9VIRU|nr:capsid protein [Sewage-associated circular DNA virus-29]AJD07551.1 capsid protein [Sewage-associated circular DNA virus-29]
MSRQVGQKWKAPKQLQAPRNAFTNNNRNPKANGRSAPLATRGFGDMGILKNREKKFFDRSTLGAPTGVSTTPVAYLLHNPAQGADYNQRIGRKTVVKSIYIRGRMFVEPVGLTPLPADQWCPGQQARLIVFIDYQPNGATPALTDLLNSADPASQLNADNRDRFKVVKDKVFTFGPVCVSNSDLVSSERSYQDFKFFKKLNLECINNSTSTNAIADIQSGALFAYFIGTNVAGSTDLVSVWTSRTRYEDM